MPGQTTRIENLKVKLFSDGADFDGMLKMAADPRIKGFTTNPTLMRKAGITDYEAFGRKVASAIPDRPISLEVFADDFDGMVRQGRTIATWAPNINVKIPVTDTQGQFTGPVIRTLADQGVALNITAILSLDQVRQVAGAINPDVPAIVSVFAGRIADTGIDPVPLMKEAAAILRDRPKAELLWASPRELLNVFHADEAGCHIITATPDILGKLKLVGKNLDAYSLETVKMFYNDAASAGYDIA